MHSKRTRLDRFISAELKINRGDVRLMLARQRITVNGVLATAANQVIEEFCHFTLDGKTLQAKTPRYVMLHKPKAVVSATVDAQHKTVIDLLRNEDGRGLHIVGRLDYNSTGLILLTNNGRWSRQLMSPQSRVQKHYRVTLENPIEETYVQAFKEGIYFAFEGVKTKPAGLRIINPHLAEVSLTEGRYHQIKRMFGYFQNPVTALHRTAIGGLALDSNLDEGKYRALTALEVLELTALSEAHN
jgi:16S rRNA pseudouridine516 synthase